MNTSHDEQSGLRDGTVLRQIIGHRKESNASTLEPATAFEAVTRQMVVDLMNEIHALRTRVDSLFSIIVGAIILDLLMRLAGWR